MDRVMANESPLLRSIQIALSRIGARVFRNNVGVLKDARGRHVRYGLAVGSSDLIGWAPVKVDESMVGKTLAVFMAVEVKAGRTRVSKGQEDFLAAVRTAGGIAVVARGESEVVAAISLLRGES